MELGLSLGGDTNNNTSSKPFGFSSSSSNGPAADPLRHPTTKNNNIGNSGLGLGFCMALGTTNPNDVAAEAANDGDDDDEEDDDQTSSEHTRDDPLQLDLLPRAPVPRRWSSENGSSGSSGNLGVAATATATARGFDVNRVPPTAGGVVGGDEVSSPNSVASSFQMDFSLLRTNGNHLIKRKNLGAGANDLVEGERASSRASDDDENGANGRKKLRLSKEQSAYLEESFKEHNTLNPKQKQALAKQLNLRPRQVEVWFQNRRARTKLKQTEVDCEYLKRCCETLTEENRRLHKELQELRALKTSNPFYMQLPATTLTMCPSCERVATTSTAPPSTTTTAPPTTAPVPPSSTTTTDSIPKPIPFPISTTPRFFPVAAHPTNHPGHQSASS